ncbi:hypothetical protein [uncultured Albimonas sp.]|uniref:hypothetical protein n=1 Tax=uncultured Albimonas sp. TaxID=1331701 RepID=UPI0030EE513C
MLHQSLAMVDVMLALWRCGGAATLAPLLAAMLRPRREAPPADARARPAPASPAFASPAPGCPAPASAGEAT